MELPSPLSAAGAAGLQAIIARPRDAVLAFDFDGVLSPIVDDPNLSRSLPGVVDTLHRLAATVGTIAIITGRQASEVLRLGQFGGLTESEHFLVFGLYGMQRWDHATGHVTSAPPPPAIAAVREILPELIGRLNVSPGVMIEDKAISIAVHTRRAEEPQAAFTALVEPLTDLAKRHGLAMEPGRLVLELRMPGVNKGNVLSAIVDERAAAAVAYFGDDLGDLPAFAVVDVLRESGVPGLKVCSGSDEVPLLAEEADLVVAGPPGVLAFLEGLVGVLEQPERTPSDH
jgi:trehalose 6-phosphate phosphatase